MRYSSEGPGFSLQSPPHQTRKTATFPDFSSVRLPSASDWSSCPKLAHHSPRCRQMEAAEVEEAERERAGAGRLTCRVRFHHCHGPFQEKCPILVVSSLT